MKSGPRARPCQISGLGGATMTDEEIDQMRRLEANLKKRTTESAAKIEEARKRREKLDRITGKLTKDLEEAIEKNKTLLSKMNKK
jgi:tRNA(Ser,Leu) C12 N-acetylase TAN1